MSSVVKKKISGWGRYPRGESFVVSPEQTCEVAPPANGNMIARGQGRAYGNAAMLQDGIVTLTERLNRVLNFDATRGLLTAEAGATLNDVLLEFVPRGWFPCVTPGTKFVSLGGCVAADVHGKNHHHDGAFGAHVAELEIVLADNSRRRCSPSSDAELFWATVGGMGLTGIITEVSFELTSIESAYMIVEHHVAPDLDSALELLESKAWDDDYTVAWIDCLSKKARLGRSVLMRGHHARRLELPPQITEPLKPVTRQPKLNLAFDLPAWILNPSTVTAFNKLYYLWHSRRQQAFITHYDKFFYSLDGIGNWNRMYGKRGFTQYQCVFPKREAREGLRKILEALRQSRRASFLAVLKRFGKAGRGLLSFPMEGYTLALDLPVDGADLFVFLELLDEIVLQHGGRVYLAKNARLSAENFRRMYPNYFAWQRIKARFDPFDRWSSDLSRNLEINALHA